MAAVRLTGTQRAGLVTLYHAARRASTLNDPKRAWVGSREGISGTTIQALERRGMAISRDAKKPYPRIVGRIRQPGIAHVREHLLEGATA